MSTRAGPVITPGGLVTRTGQTEVRTSLPVHIAARGYGPGRHPALQIGIHQRPNRIARPSLSRSSSRMAASCWFAAARTTEPRRGSCPAASSSQVSPEAAAGREVLERMAGREPRMPAMSLTALR